MRNLSVIVQEFGRAERSGNSADGFLFVNKKKEDQRLAFYTKKLEQNHLIEEVDRAKEQFLQSRWWVYSIYSGGCLRWEIISKFGEGELELQCTDGCCSSCGIKDEETSTLSKLSAFLYRPLLTLVNHKPVRKE